ncbi:chromate efflux transporter [Yoonia sediminilitoris]|uniref:Chromate transporter n=1 Tax=Yoonia sediminilitoris TaxID=1286148 RepID=A0A2T6K959_9RHOB|nr:chromate efflux transporter [Yoonia sediminilitoris]PUB11299.1 chromate transporter [Yoonia sediminilitoris]RCW91115.1 chromate transporter [Yoonia sediminilitoris]
MARLRPPSRSGHGTPPITDMIRVFGRIGLLSFGGPAAQIALMHKELVESRDWLTEQQFLRALSFCMLLPGPEAMQLATYAGWKRHGVVGGLIGGLLFVIPGAIVIAILALLYGQYGNLPVAQAMFLGIKATVVVIVINALVKISGRALVQTWHWLVALAGFVALFLFAIPFPIVIAFAAMIGASVSTTVPQETDIKGHPDLSQSGRVIAIGATIWAAPLVAAYLLDAPFMVDLGLFFSKLAVVTFGGAYAVLAYMTQEVVGSYGWLTTPQMMDALGLAETTPGPLILVTQFVGMLAGMAEGGIATALLAGAITLWVTFVPCFIWIFAGAPLIDWLEGRPRLQGALHGVTAAVVGVIANLSLWFSLHVFFRMLHPVQSGPLQTLVPELQSINPVAVGLAAIAAIAMQRARLSLPIVLAMSAALGFLVHLAAPSFQIAPSL